MRPATENEDPDGEARPFSKKSGGRIYRLNKAVYSIQNNAAKFLNGITSNTLDRPSNAFLDVHGKAIATFDQIKVGDDEFLIVLERELCEPVLAHIGRYVSLSKVKIETREFYVYFDLDGEELVGKGNFSIPQKRGRLILARQEFKAEVSDEKFTLFRLRNNIPLPGKDFHNDFILNISVFDYVSFTKGCFLGQEPVAKVQSRSKPSWKLVVRPEDECDEEQKKKMTSKTLDPQIKKVIGFVFVSNS